VSEIRVECYSGQRADERPVCFVARENEYVVEAVEDKWYSPDATYFRVTANDGNVYVLRHDEAKDVWTMDAFRARGERAVRED
jgi:hypothetical protein